MTTIPIYNDLPVEPDAILEQIFDVAGRKGNLVRLYHQQRNVAPIHQSKIERLYRQARPMRIYEGSSEVLRLGIAKQLVLEKA